MFSEVKTHDVLGSDIHRWRAVFECICCARAQSADWGVTDLITTAGMNQAANRRPHSCLLTQISVVACRKLTDQLAAARSASIPRPLGG